MMFGESDWREKMDERKPHKWSKVIKAWADGKPIQYKAYDSPDWHDVEKAHPFFDNDFLEWRVKPEAIVVENYIWLDASCNETGVTVSSNPNVRFTFDTDTKKLIKAEVIR